MCIESQFETSNHTFLRDRQLSICYSLPFLSLLPRTPCSFTFQRIPLLFLRFAFFSRKQFGGFRRDGTSLCFCDFPCFFWKVFQLEFGAYRGLAPVLKSPSNPQNCRKKETILEKGTFFLRQTLVCTKPWFKRDLSFATRQAKEYRGRTSRKLRVLSLFLFEFPLVPFEKVVRFDQIGSILVNLVNFSVFSQALVKLMQLSVNFSQFSSSLVSFKQIIHDNTARIS